MKSLLQVLENVQAHSLASQKTAIWISYFKNLDSSTFNSIVHLFFHQKEYILTDENTLEKLFLEQNNYDENILSDSLDISNNYLEIISLLVSNQQIKNEYSLKDLLIEIREKRNISIDKITEYIHQKWQELDQLEVYLFHLIITGSLTQGWNQKNICRALSIIFSYSEDWVQQQLSKHWDSEKIHFTALLKGKNELSEEFNYFEPIQFQHSYLPSQKDHLYSYNIEDKILAYYIIKEEKHFIQYLNKRIQVFHFEKDIKINNTVFLILLIPTTDCNSIENQLHSSNFPTEEIEHIELLDILYSESISLKDLKYVERLKLIQEMIFEDSIFKLPSVNSSSNKNFLISHDHIVGEKYLIQQNPPYSINAVLTHANLGLGRKETHYTDYTFSIRDQQQLKSIVKIKASECREYEKIFKAFISKNTVQKFGNLVSIKPELIFELIFSKWEHQETVKLKSILIKKACHTVSLDHLTKLSDINELKSI